MIKDCFFKAAKEFVNVKVVHPNSLESTFKPQHFKTPSILGFSSYTVNIYSGNTMANQKIVVNLTKVRLKGLILRMS